MLKGLRYEKAYHCIHFACFATAFIVLFHLKFKGHAIIDTAFICF